MTDNGINYYGWLLFLHIASASAFFMAMIIMQLVVANVMRRIPESAGKKEGVLFIQTRWHPVVDGVIILVGVSAVLLAALNWDIIFRSALFTAKTIIGLVALSSACSNHFYFRHKKRALAASGKNPGLLNKLGKTTAILDKVALVGGSVTVLLAWYENHV